MEWFYTRARGRPLSLAVARVGRRAPAAARPAARARGCLSIQWYFQVSSHISLSRARAARGSLYLYKNKPRPIGTSPQVT